MNKGKICTFRKSETGFWYCSECGFIQEKRSRKKPTRICPNQEYQNLKYIPTSQRIGLSNG